MTSYTLDAVGLLRYFADTLPDLTDAIFDEAEAGDAAIQLPSITLVEALYIVDKREKIMGTPLNIDAGQALGYVRSEVPVSIVETTSPERDVLLEFLDLSIHDAMLVASHRVQNTDAIITTDPAIADAGIPVVWD